MRPLHILHIGARTPIGVSENFTPCHLRFIWQDTKDIIRMGCVLNYTFVLIYSQRDGIINKDSVSQDIL